MKTLYLAYRTEFDDETRTWCVEGRDVRGEAFGVGAGQDVAEAVDRLKDWVLESLSAAAADGQDFLGDLAHVRPAGDHVALTGQDLLPIELRLRRVRRHLRQADVAERLGITQQAYRKLERPGANLTVGTIVRLEEALGEELVRVA